MLHSEIKLVISVYFFMAGRYFDELGVPRLYIHFRR
jgi:hypothetical protein